MNYQEYVKKRDDLFQRWESSSEEFDQCEEFTYDGIVAKNQEEWKIWEESPIKILFLLKEALGGYHPDNKSDLQTKKPFSHNIALWRYAIEKTFIERKPLSYTLPSESDLSPNTTGISIVEVKKCNQERSASINKDILYHAKRDKAFLMEQIDLINPQVVVCCYTVDSYDEIYSDTPPDELLKKEGKVGLHKQYNGRLIIDFYHPSIRGGNERKQELYTLLCELLSNGDIFNQFDWGKV